MLNSFGCSNSHSKVTVTGEENIHGCHMCPGYLFIERGNTIDTLKRGSWGKPPSFNQFKTKDRDYIALESSYFSGGINESKLSILSLNEDNYLTSVFDTLISDEQIDYLMINRRNLEFRSPDTLLVHQHNEIFNSNDERSKRADSLSELYIINKTSLFSEVNEIKVRNLIMPYAGKSVQGGLIVSNGIKIDTIYDCSYGRFPDYRRVISGETDYLLTTCDINGGGNNVRNYFIWSLENETFMDTLFHKQFFTSEESSLGDHYPGCILWTQREIYVSFKNKIVALRIDSLTTILNWDTAESVDTISAGEKTTVFEISRR